MDLEVEKDKRLPTKTTIKKEEGKYFSRQVEREREEGRWGERGSINTGRLPREKNPAVTYT